MILKRTGASVERPRNNPRFPRLPRAHEADEESNNVTSLGPRGLQSIGRPTAEPTSDQASFVRPHSPTVTSRPDVKHQWGNDERRRTEGGEEEEGGRRKKKVPVIHTIADSISRSAARKKRRVSIDTPRERRDAATAGGPGKLYYATRETEDIEMRVAVY